MRLNYMVGYRHLQPGTKQGEGWELSRIKKPAERSPWFCSRNTHMGLASHVLVRLNLKHVFMMLKGKYLSEE